MKKQKIELEIIDLTENGDGVARFEQKIVFVHGALVGDIILAEVISEKKKYIKAKIIKVIKASKDRIEPPCNYAYKCGGCSIMQLDYDTQLTYKTKFVNDALTRIGGQKDYQQYPIVSMTFPYYYRNKAIYPFAEIGGKVELGLYQKATHKLVPINTCMLQHDENRLIISVVKDWANQYNISVYDEKNRKGILRYLMIKTTATNQHMVGIIVAADKLPFQTQLIKALENLSIDISSIMLVVNKNRGNAVLGKKIKCLAGNDYIIDIMDGIKYKLSLSSFFQVNHQQAAKLYHITEALCELSGEEIVWDIYCGVGSITLRLAKKAKWVYGNEIVPAAIVNAKENARLNGIENVTFIEGAAEDIVPTWLDKYPRPDVIVLDPPRKGADKKVLDSILKLKPERIVYVSCKASTLARDIKILTETDYKLIESTPVDMFPHSGHVETVALLSKL